MERAVRRRLDKPDVWTVIAYFGLAAVVVGLFFVNQQTQKTVSHQARDEAIRVAQIKGSAAANYTACIKSIPELRKISTHLAGVNQLADVLVTNGEAVLEATPRSDPQYPIRHANLVRLLRSREKIGAVRALPVPTRTDCLLRRSAALQQLGTDN